MKRTSFLIVTFLILTLGVSILPSQGQGTEQKKSPMPIYPVPVVAHRGSSFAAPENTLAAAKLSIEMGANGSECDVYRTSDNKVVLLHDSTFKRTAGLDKRVVDCDYETVSKLDVGSWKDKKFAGEKVPTLKEYLKLFVGTPCRPVIEIKMEGIEQLVIDDVREAGLVDHVVVIAFSQNVVKKMRELEPNISVAWLYGDKHEGTPLELADLLTKRARECDTTVLDLNHTLITPELLKILRDRGFHVWAWTVDDPNRMETLLRWGIDSITTNKPDLLIEVMSKK